MATINTTDVTNGTVADAGVINSNFSAVKAVVNGALANDNVQPGAGIEVSKLAPGSNGQVLTTTGGVATWGSSGGPSGDIPVGSGSLYFGASAPPGWLLCDGSAVSRGTYSLLFTAIGTAYGSGDGSSTFNIPDLRGRIPVGKGTHTDVDALGEHDGVTTVGDRRPKHKHTVNDPGHSHTQSATSGTFGSGGASGAASSSNPTSTNTTGVTVGPQTNVSTDAPSYLVLNYIIYAGV